MNRETYIKVISGETKGLWPGFMRAFLSFLSSGYFLGWLARDAGYKLQVLPAHSVAARIISIGNITAGGTGKTPAVAYLAGRFHEEGARVVIISRGYGRKITSDDPAVVSNLKGSILLSPEMAGDEPYLLAKKLPGIPVIVCGKRLKAAQAAIEQFAPDVILLDDGFQHRALARDEDVVIIDANQPFGFGHLLPRGLLREPLRALKRANSFILTHANERKHAHVVEKLMELNPSAEILFSRHRPVGLRNPAVQAKLAPDILAGKRIFAVSSIGNPRSFERTLIQLEAVITGTLRFPDHYWYAATDVENIRHQAEKAAVEFVVTTEKDATRLDLLKEKIENLLVLEIELEIIGQHPGKPIHGGKGKTGADRARWHI